MPERIFDLPGIDKDAFRSAMDGAPEVSIKLNRRKCSDIAETGYAGTEPVKWCRSGFYLKERPKFTLNPLLHAGVFYVQDASSMVYETIVERLRGLGLLPERPLVIDLCAAPGGKTGSIINALPDGSIIVANEVMPKRVKILRENLLKWGYPDTIVTNSRTADVAALGEMFDLVAVDAPCSGEGMMRKDAEAVAQWSEGLVAQCSALQKEILADAVAALRPGGVLIFSTCTFNRRENEENVSWLAGQFGLEPVEMDFPTEWGIGKAIDSQYPAYRFMPHLTRGEGLFVAVLRKPGVPHAQSTAKRVELIKRRLRVLDGMERNRNAKPLKGNDAVPNPVEPLMTDFVHGKYPEIELSEEHALRYLRHEALRLDDDTPKGFVVVTYKGHPLGFVKNIGSRANNLYPAEWRIRTL